MPETKRRTDIMTCGAFAAALGEKLSLIERLDVLVENAEGRRASALRELQRYREALAEQAQRATHGSRPMFVSP
jgi:hypothetical protein